MVACAPEYVGLEVEIRGVARLRGQQSVDLRERLVVTVLLVADDGEIVPGRGEAGRACEAALEQRGRIVPATRAHREIGEHAQRCRIVGLPREMRSQQVLGVGEPAFDEGRRGREQLGPGRRDGYVAGPGRIGTRGIARVHQVVGDQSPGFANAGLERHGATQCRKRRVAPAGVAKRHAQLVVHRCRFTLAPGQRFENRERSGQVAELPPGHGEEQRRHGAGPRRVACRRISVAARARAGCRSAAGDPPTPAARP